MKKNKLRKQKKFFFKTTDFGIDIVSQSKSHLKKIKKSLELIKNTDRALFKKVLCLKAILIYPGESEYGAVYEKERIYIDQPKTISGTSLVWLASSLVHEAWHIDQYKRKIREYGVKTERGAYLVQRKFLLKAGLKADVKWLDKMYKLQWWQPETTKFKKDVGYNDTSVDRTRLDFWKFLNKYTQGKLRLVDIES